MHNIFITLLLCLGILLSGCQDQADNAKQDNKTFDLAKVKQQYQGIALNLSDISEQSYQNGAALAISFSTPLNPKENVQDFFKLSDKNKQTIDGSWIISENGLRVYFPEIEPASLYTVEVYKGLTSATGQVLNENHKQAIETRAMAAQVSFASQGSVLAGKLSKGLPVISVNIDEVDVDFHRIKEDKLHHFLSLWHRAGGRTRQNNYYLQDYAPYTELVYSGRFALNPVKNTRHQSHLDLTAIDSLKPAGIYLAVMNPAGSYQSEHQVSYFSISDIGLHTRVYSDRISIYTSSLADGSALSDVSLNLLDEKDNILQQARSDALGQAVFNTPTNKARLVIARKQNHIGLLQLKTAALDLSEFAIAGREHKALEIFSYGPRDLYRPGELVKINALLRDADGQFSGAPTLNAVIKRPDGQKIKYFSWHAEKNLAGQAFYQTEYSLPANAMTGLWSMELKAGANKLHNYSFQVEAFLPERMELVLGDSPSTTENWTNREDSLEIPVSGDYLYGAPAAKNKLSSKVLIEANRKPLNAFKEYYFGLADEKPPVRYFEQGDIKLDELGKALLKVPSRWQAIEHSPFTIKVIASLFESGGRPVTRTIDYQLWPQSKLIGIRPQFKLDAVPSETELSFDIIQSNLEGELQASTELEATLIQERRDYYWEYSDAEGWHQNYSSKNIKSFQQQIVLNNTKATRLTVPVEWGSYLLTIKDPHSGQTSSLRFHAGTGWQAVTDGQSARPERIVMKLDKKNYQNGDTAKLHILPPYSAQTLLTLEDSEKTIWSKRLSIAAEGKTIEIPIAKDWKRHDLYLSAVSFRAGNSTDNITPNRAVGIIHLPLKRDKQKLSIEIDHPEAVVRAESKLQTQIKVSGLPTDKSAYVTLAAVDVGVLNITDYPTPDPHNWFFQPRRYAVEQHDMYNKIIELVDGERVAARFGGDADKRAGGARPDTSVKIVSLFSGPVETDKNGQARIELSLPDFNGRLRLMALAFNDQQFGSAEAEITVAAPIIAEASLPRFLAAGDKSQMTLDIRNQSGETQELELVVNADSVIKLNSISQSFTLKDKEKTVLQIPISAAETFDQGVIKLNLKNTGEASEAIIIQRQWPLAVRPAYPAVTRVERKVLSADETISLKPALEDLMLASAESQLTLSSQPPINIQQHLKSLLSYPYGCLEQTISSSYPWISIEQQKPLLESLNKIKISRQSVDINKRADYIEAGINRVAAMQRSNGSFGLWSNRDQEEHWLTAYAAEFLLDAREKGYPVADPLINKTLKRLKQYLNHRGIMYGERYSQAVEHYNFAYKAYAAYLLSRVNQAPLGSLRSLYDHHQQDAKSALPLAHIGLALYNQGDKKRGLEALDNSLHKARDRNVYLADYGSRLRDMALISYLLNKHPLPVSGKDSLIFQLADELAARQYLSTQERHALFRAGLRFLTAEKPLWQGELQLDDSKLQLKQNSDYKERFKAGDIPDNLKFTVPKESSQPVYLQFELNAYPKSASKMQMQEIKIQRHYYDLEGQKIEPKKHSSGDVLLVHLTIHADRRIKDALLIDLIPAGFELENQNLDHSLDIEKFTIDNNTIASMQYYSQSKYQEYLDDRFIAAIDLHKNTPEHLFYLMRAVTKGQYHNPPPYAEDMYRPYIRAIGQSFKTIEIN